MGNKKVIGIFSSLGIPPRYGGLETLAWYISNHLSKNGYKVLVQTKKGDDNNEKNSFSNYLIPVYFSRKDSLIGDLLYDLKAFLTMSKKVDIALVLGYGSAPFLKIFKINNIPLILHTAGMEWQRPRFNDFQRYILKYFEKIGANSADHLIVDSLTIKKYMDSNYNTESTYISYGAEIFDVNKSDLPLKTRVKPNDYFLFIGRLEPSTSVDYIIKEFVKSKRKEKLLLVGPILPSYKNKLETIAGNDKRIIFAGEVYGNPKGLFALRKYACSSINGHRTGGTPPSLIEALSAGRHIIAHNNPYIHDALGDIYTSYYDYIPNSLSNILNELDDDSLLKEKDQQYINRYESMFKWPIICQEYEELFDKII